MNTVLISKLLIQEHSIDTDLSMNKYDILYLDVIGQGYFPITMLSIQLTYSRFDCLDQYAICTGVLNWVMDRAIVDFHHLEVDVWIVI